MFSKEKKVEWSMLFAIGVILFFLYGFDIREMFKRILEWGFALIGYDLIIDTGIKQKLNESIREKT